MHDTPPPSAPPARVVAGARLMLRDVRRRFDTGVVAIDGITLDIPPGQFLAVLGPSGCGKSTLLRLIAGLDFADGGALEINHAQFAGPSPLPHDSPRADIAYVFQDAHLLPWRTVLGNVELPLELMRLGKAPRRERARQALERVGLAGAGERYPAQLSGGMRMRVSLARALVTGPKLLLLDEPFAALDEITREHLDDQLRELWADTGVTVVFVTHSTAEAAFLAERAVVLSRGPGRVVADHVIDLPTPRTPATRATPAFAAATRVLYESLAKGGA